jgi:NADH-quinone oxidoreductase subunit L
MIDNPNILVWLIPALPLVSAVITALLGSRVLKSYSHVPTVAAAAGSCVLSVLLLLGLALLDGQQSLQLKIDGFKWFSTHVLPGDAPLRFGALDIRFNLQVDSLTAVMLIAITFVGTFIAVFSSGYMHGDPGYPRFFAIMSLFLFSMTGLVLADNFLVLYAFWEGVGLCSYLLVVFWFQKPSAAAAARKAFLVTRLGDAGMILGIMLLWARFGNSLDFDTVFGQAALAGESSVLTLACLLLFCGAVGKSAQFPLHVWLPDAMEGPTPASALIHAATMVTAGVYLVARCSRLFALSPTAQLVVACIGGVTALLGALIALTQTDLKRVLAYSTISQLGYMFLGLGAGLIKDKLIVFAVAAAIFHLFTHAFFKALLFLSAGSVMHGMGHVIDMRRLGGLRKVMPITHWSFLCGAVALAGLIPFSGFWSKDEILEAVLQAGEHSDAHNTVYLVLFATALITAALTAFYTFRAYFKTFWGELRIPDEAYHHGHSTPHDHAEPNDHQANDDRQKSFESPSSMTLPLVVLAIGALFVGLIFEGATHWMGDFLAKSAVFVQFHGYTPEHGFDWLMFGLSMLCAAGGVGLAAWMYLVKPGIADTVASALKPAYNLSLNRFWFDEIYALLIVAPLTLFATVCRLFDSIVDGIVDLVGLLPRQLARGLQPIQNGLVQFYALVTVVFVAAFVIVFALWIRQ